MLGSFRPRLLAAFVLAVFAFVSTPAFAADSDVAPAVQTASVVNLPNIAAIVREQTAEAAEAAAPKPAVLAPTTPRPLRDLVISYVDYGNQDAEELCLAKAVYFEARSESLEGQLAVAEVVLNRAASGVYPPSICAVVTQPAQFSFIRGGRFPTPDTKSDCWHRALAIAEIARKRLASQVDRNVLWYHASYVSPSWGRAKNRAARIGTHIFYS
jgi:spore germination cell wall hydrolase CwlJ-like protein